MTEKQTDTLRKRERETARETDRHYKKERDRQTDRQTDRELIMMPPDAREGEGCGEGNRKHFT